MFKIVTDFDRIYTRGAEFTDHDISMTAHECCWPERLTVRNLNTNERFEIRSYRKRKMQGPRQRLETLDHTEALEPTGNGGFRRVRL